MVPLFLMSQLPDLKGQLPPLTEDSNVSPDAPTVTIGSRTGSCALGLRGLAYSGLGALEMLGLLDAGLHQRHL